MVHAQADHMINIYGIGDSDEDEDTINCNKSDKSENKKNCHKSENSRENRSNGHPNDNNENKLNENLISDNVSNVFFWLLNGALKFYSIKFTFKAISRNDNFPHFCFKKWKLKAKQHFWV